MTIEYTRVYNFKDFYSASACKAERTFLMFCLAKSNVENSLWFEVFIYSGLWPHFLYSLVFNLWNQNYMLGIYNEQ